MIDYVRELEKLNSRERGEYIVAFLKRLGIEHQVQQSCGASNIIVDYDSNPRFIFSAHYDVLRPPGANDNASSVAVLLRLCQILKLSPAPVRVIFFDKEEAWFYIPVFRLGLLGSFCYTWKNSLKRLDAVYNLEFCGAGEVLAVWPVKTSQRNLPAVKAAKRIATGLNIPFTRFHIPWLFFSSDHLSFRLKGMANAVTLSLLPANELEMLEKWLAKTNILKRLVGLQPTLPELLSYIHTPQDTSSRLSESSLERMLSILIGLIKEDRS